MLGPIWIETVWQSWKNFKKKLILKKSADNKEASKITQYARSLRLTCLPSQYRTPKSLNLNMKGHTAQICVYNSDGRERAGVPLSRITRLEFCIIENKNL